jgi:hypothetical protein
MKGEEMRNRNWFLRRLVLGFAIALVVVPVAQARPEGALPPLAQAGANTQGTFVQGVDDFPGSSKLAPQANGVAVRGEVKDGVGSSTSGVPADFAQDNQYAYRGIVVTTSGVPADFAKDNEFAYRNALPQDIAEPVQVVSTSDGFDWGDAGIGAGTLFAVLLLGAGALLATRHVGHPAQV